MDPHALSDHRSLAYHRAVAACLGQTPALVERARDTLERWRAQGGRAMHLLERWASLLQLPAATIAARIVEETEEMRELRHASPFAGVLTPRERWRIWRQVRQAHEGER